MLLTCDVCSIGARWFASLDSRISGAVCLAMSGLEGKGSMGGMRGKCEVRAGEDVRAGNGTCQERAGTGAGEDVSTRDGREGRGSAGGREGAGERDGRGQGAGGARRSDLS